MDDRKGYNCERKVLMYIFVYIYMINTKFLAFSHLFDVPRHNIGDAYTRYIKISQFCMNFSSSIQKLLVCRKKIGSNSTLTDGKLREHCIPPPLSISLLDSRPTFF